MVVDDDLTAFVGETEGDLTAEKVSGTGNENDFVNKIRRHSPLCSGPPERRCRPPKIDEYSGGRREITRSPSRPRLRTGGTGGHSATGQIRQEEPDAGRAV